MKTKLVAKVLLDCRNELANRRDRYDNYLGCGNCGNIGPAYHTLVVLTEALADLLPTKTERKKFLALAVTGSW